MSEPIESRLEAKKRELKDELIKLKGPIPILSALRFPPREPIILKVQVSNGQARLTIPKELAVHMHLLTETGEQGKNTHAIMRCENRSHILVTFSRIAEETTETS